MYIYFIENKLGLGLYVVASDIKKAVDLFINSLDEDENKEVDKIECISGIKINCIESINNGTI